MSDVALEVEALQAIYDADFLFYEPPDLIVINVVPAALTELLAEGGASSFGVDGVKVQVQLPDGYPSTAITEHCVRLHAPWVARETEIDTVAEALKELPPDGPAVFDLVEAVKRALPLPPSVTQMMDVGDQASALAENAASASEVPSAPKVERTAKETRFDWSASPMPIVVGAPFTDRKSTFQAFAASVCSVKEVELFCDFLKSNSKIAQSTHNMVAYRLVSDGRVNQDHDSDGEDAAGGRLQHLLQLAGTENVVVMVTRWYGGIHLGPDRFKHINNAARQVLQEGGHIPEKKSKKR